MRGRPLIKICGLANQADLDAVARLGFDFAGFIFAEKSPRRVTPEQAAGLHSQGIKRVGVFVEQGADEIRRIMRAARLDYAQLHGEQRPEDCAALAPHQVIKVFWPERHEDAAALEADMRRFAEHAAFFLLDAGQGGGGSGQAFAWERLRSCAMPRPWILAGGLSPKNAQAALALCLPRMAGLDVNSGVESRPGQKNHEALARLHNVLKKLQ